MKKNHLFAVSLISVLLIAGCGGPERPPGMPQLHGCVLSFTFEDGSSVGEGAIVSLSPEDTDLNQWSISGVTDASGTATIYTHADFRGAPSGSYKVRIQKFESDMTERDEYGEPVLRSALPSRYDSTLETPFSLEITGQAVQQEFRLER